MPLWYSNRIKAGRLENRPFLGNQSLLPKTKGTKVNDMTRKKKSRDGRIVNGGARAGAGRKKLAVEKKNTTVKAEPWVFDQARQNHGTLEKALLFAALNKPGNGIQE